MNYRFNLMRRAWYVLCGLVLCGSVVSCSEDYTLDEVNPSWLNTSIYEYLKNPPKEDGSYQNFVRLIDDLGYAEVLAKTGSKTLFVANDAAFDEFYKNCPWENVSGYDDLSLSQKKLLLNSAMVNNAYLLEMMSSTEGPVAGQCLRRETAATALDSVPYFAPDSLPFSYNEVDEDVWARFRTPEKNGLHMALDYSNPMMTHFLATQMANRGITDDDFEIIVGTKRAKNDAYIYDCKVVEQDIVCQNGYVNRLDKVLLTPQNMAETLRTNGRTNIFSHMIERFSVPVYNNTLTTRYRLLYGNDVDSVYEKRYYNKHVLHSYYNDNSDNEHKHGLKYDLGWNAFQSTEKTSIQQEMATLFAPSDERLYEYFFSPSGGGRFLLDAFAPTELTQVTGPTDFDNIYRAIDKIPREKLEEFLNNMMKTEFCSTVPSKFETVKDDAQDQMLEPSDIDRIEKVLLANNGVIYLMDEVLTSPTYAAVLGPAYVGTDMQVMNYAIWNGVDGINKDFYAYLRAMSSRFSFFVPRDGFIYIDPVSFSTGREDKLRAIKFEWVVDKNNNGKISATSFPMTYDHTNGEFSIDLSKKGSTVSQTEYLNRLMDILNTHTIVHEDSVGGTTLQETKLGVECDKHYFLSKSGAPIYVKNATLRDNGMQVAGGWGLQHKTWATVTRFDDKTRESNGKGNGMAYQLDEPIVPTIESVYSLMYNNRDQDSIFLNLCQEDITDLLKELKDYLYKDENGKAIFNSESEYTDFYRIFINRNGIPCYDKQTGKQVADAPTNVRFFSNYNYTVYVPSNLSMLKAIDNGLPTWESIYEVLKMQENDRGKLESQLTDEEMAVAGPKAAAMTTYLISFLKYHFQDQSIFADTPSFSEQEFGTATMDRETGVSIKVHVSSTGNGTLSIRDQAGKTTSTIDRFSNQIARDYIIKSNRIDASSFVAVHGLMDVLHFKALTGEHNDRYDGDWATSSAARRFIKKYQLMKK